MLTQFLLKQIINCINIINTVAIIVNMVAFETQFNCIIIVHTVKIQFNCIVIVNVVDIQFNCITIINTVAITIQFNALLLTENYFTKFIQFQFLMNTIS